MFAERIDKMMSRLAEKLASPKRKDITAGMSEAFDRYIDAKGKIQSHG